MARLSCSTGATASGRRGEHGSASACPSGFPHHSTSRIPGERGVAPRIRSAHGLLLERRTGVPSAELPVRVSAVTPCVPLERFLFVGRRLLKTSNYLDIKKARLTTSRVRVRTRDALQPAQFSFPLLNPSPARLVTGKSQKIIREKGRGFESLHLAWEFNLYHQMWPHHQPRQQHVGRLALCSPPPLQ